MIWSVKNHRSNCADLNSSPNLIEHTFKSNHKVGLVKSNHHKSFSRDLNQIMIWFAHH